MTGAVLLEVEEGSWHDPSALQPKDYFTPEPVIETPPRVMARAAGPLGFEFREEEEVRFKSPKARL